MFRRILLILLIFSLLSTPAIAQGEDFHFTNWPIPGFENRVILNSYSDSHFGVDVAANVGEKVEVVANGKVYWTYSGGSHGIAVGVEHDNGWRTTYLHLSKKLVKRGQQVRAGEVIGEVGITGTGRDAEEPHLHFSLIIDPKESIKSASKRYADPMLFSPIVLAGNDNSPTEDIAEQNTAKATDDATNQQSSESKNALATGSVQPVKQENILIEEEKQPDNLAETKEKIALRTDNRPASILAGPLVARIEKPKSELLPRSHKILLVNKGQTQKNGQTDIIKKKIVLEPIQKTIELLNKVTNKEKTSGLKSVSRKIPQKSFLKLDKIYVAVVLWLILVFSYLLIAFVVRKKKIKPAC